MTQSSTGNVGILIKFYCNDMHLKIETVASQAEAGKMLSKE